MASATPDLRLPSQPQGITTPRPVPSSLLGDRGTCVCKQPSVSVVWSCWWTTMLRTLANCTPHAVSNVPLCRAQTNTTPTGIGGDKPGGRRPLLSARPAVTPTTLKRAATSFAAWWTETRRVWTVCLRLLPYSVATVIWTQALLRLSLARANHSATEPPRILNSRRYMAQADAYLRRHHLNKLWRFRWTRRLLHLHRGECVSVAEWLARLTVVWEDPGSNHAADSCVYRDSCCDIQSWARAVHLYCSA